MVDIRASPWCANVDPSNDSLQVQHGRTHKIVERKSDDDKKKLGTLIMGPETVVVGKDGSLYFLSETGHLVELLDIAKDDDPVAWTARAVTVQDLGVGRPLGGRFTPDGKTLYIADSVLGLTRISNIRNPAAKVELVASTVPMWKDDTVVVDSPLRYVNAVAIGSKTGRVYFTDSTDIPSDRIRVFQKRGKYQRLHWDTMYAAKLDLVRGRAAGRLCEYDPSSNQVRVLADGLKFANGLAVDPDETFVVVAETYGTRLLKFPLEDTKVKRAADQPPPRNVDNDKWQVLVDSQDMVGYIDNVDCAYHSRQQKVQCYAAVISAMVPMHKFWMKLPEVLQLLLRTVAMIIPRSWAPDIKSYGGVLVVDPADPASFYYLQDPVGRDISRIAGVTVIGDQLYLGSLTNDYIGVYDL